MRCEDLMKRDVISVGPDDTVQLAAKRMRDGNVGFLPVCEGSGRVLGTVTDRDIAIRAAADDRLPSACLVREVMTSELVSCRAADDLSRAERLMGSRKKSRLLVTDGDGLLQGVLSLSDIAQFEGARRTGATIREVSSREVHW